MSEVCAPRYCLVSTHGWLKAGTCAERPLNGEAYPVRTWLSSWNRAIHIHTYIHIAPCAPEHFLSPEIYVNQHQALVIDQHCKVACNGMSSKTEVMEQCNAMLDATHGRSCHCTCL